MGLATGRSYLAIAGILVLGFAGTVVAQTTEPMLRLEIGTHHAGIFSIATDSSNRILITGSEDKTVRVWDLSGTGELRRILRPPANEGENGQIFAVALSPDAATVACGGRTGSLQRNDICVYLFNRVTGSLVRRLGGLPGFICNLTYTADGRFLVVAMGRGGLRLYRVPDYELAAEDLNYRNMCVWAGGDPTGSRLATSSLDGFIRLYDLSAVRTLSTSSPPPLLPISKLQSPGGQRPNELAFSPDGSRIAVGYHFSHRVDVLEVKGNALQHAYSPDTSGVRAAPGTDLRSVAWSADGRFLYAGGLYVTKGAYTIRKWSDGGRGEPKDLPLGAHLPLLQLLTLRTGGVAYCSRDGSFGRLSERDEASILSPRAIPIHAGNQAGFLLSADGAGIQFAYEWPGKSPAVFLVHERQLTDGLSGLWAGLKARFTWEAPLTEGLGVSDWKGSLAPKLKGTPLPVKNDPAQSLAVMPDRSGFLLGTASALRFFDPAGKEAWKVNTPGAAYGVNTNGRLAVAALGDGTIRWYRVSDGREVLSFFPHPDRKRWVLWTPSGYYDASPGGEDFIGWHVNNDRDQAADFFPASRFRSTRYRPDVIDRVLAAADEAVALQQADELAGRRPVAEAPVREKLPPVAAIISPADGSAASESPLKISYSVRSPESLTGLKALVDGRPIAVEGIGKTPRASGDLSIPIPPRDCEVSIIAENRYSVSEPATIRLRWKGAVPKEAFEIKPKLYVLAVGVSKYHDPELRLNLAAKDALDFGAAWNDQKGRLYSGVEVRALTDAQATKGNILDALEWLQRQVTAKDIAVLFFAGHGVNDPTGAFYFLPVDADLEKLKRTGISQADITSTVASLAGKVLVFVDACHSGNLMGKEKRRGVVVVSSVVNELASAENGAVVFSSTTGRQYALENMEWGNGAFTKGAVEGIRGKADYTATGRITVNMLDLYMSERVKELTQGQQTPTTVKPPNLPDFPVALVR